MRAAKARKVIEDEAAKYGWRLAFFDGRRGSFRLEKNGIARVDHGGSPMLKDSEEAVRYSARVCIEAGKRIVLNGRRV